MAILSTILIIFCHNFYPFLIHFRNIDAMNTAKGFWDRVDTIRDGKSLKDLADDGPVGVSTTLLLFPCEEPHDGEPSNNGSDNDS